MKNLLILACALLYFPTLLLAQQVEYISPAGTKFLLYLPPSYQTGSQQHPLLISLHGRSQIGDDLTKLTSSSAPQMPARLIYLNKWPKDYPFIVVSPQFNYPNLSDPHPVWPPEHIDEVVNFVLSQFRIDQTKVYLTGLSMGAFATWNYTAAFPDKVAAIVPMSGRTDLTKACLVKDVPAWVFHGDNDPTVNVNYSIDFINAIGNCTPIKCTPRLNILFTKNHNGWNEIYNGTNGYRIYDWLLKFIKGSTDNTAPYVDAGPDLTVRLSDKSLCITGDAFDSDGTLTNLVWRRLSGPLVSLSYSGTETLRINKLLAGVYEFELSATDNSGAKVKDTLVLTVFESSTLPEVTKMFLVNGVTNADVMELTNETIVDKNVLQLSQINIRVAATENTRSVKFSVNTNRNTRTINSPGPYFLRTQVTGTEWDVKTGEYVICATPYTSSSAKGTPGLSRCFKIKVREGTPTAECAGAGLAYREVWAGIEGTSISSIPTTTPPVTKGVLYKFEGPTDVGDNYGARIRAYLRPPQSGAYTFWISSNDRSELWLSTDSNPANKQKIAYVNGYTGVRQWTKYTTQQSLPVQLTAGEKYYVEALHKEGTGTDNLAVGWRLPDNVTYERPIPGFRLIPYQETTLTSTDTSDSAYGEVDGISIFPNPAGPTDDLTISGLTDNQNEGITIRICSLTGTELMRSNRTSSTQAIEFPLEGRLNPGMYIVKVSSNNKTVTRRIIIRP